MKAVPQLNWKEDETVHLRFLHEIDSEPDLHIQKNSILHYGNWEIVDEYPLNSSDSQTKSSFLRKWGISLSMNSSMSHITFYPDEAVGQPCPEQNWQDWKFYQQGFMIWKEHIVRWKSGIEDQVKSFVREDLEQCLICLRWVEFVF